MTERYDLIIIGGGPGGYPAALRAAKLGKKVAVVEMRELGGTCLNRGCIPTKTLLHTSELYRELLSADGIGIHAENVSVDMERLYERMEQVVETLRDGIAASFKKSQIALYHGKGVVLDAAHVRVEGGKEVCVIEGAFLLISTGSRPAMPPIPGCHLPGVMDSDALLQNRDRINRLLIVGGGVIGMEFATLYHGLGSQVTVIEAMERILPGMDKEISQNLKMVMGKRGVDLHANAKVISIEAVEHGLCCTYEEKNITVKAEADHILISTGRRPNTEGLFDSQMKIPKMERGYLCTDQHYQTDVPGIYAIGDVIGGIQLAHVATAEGIHAVNRMFGDNRTQCMEVVPSCVYTNPEIATVGITAAEAKEAGIPVETGKYIMSVNGKSVLSMQDRGFIKLVVHQETGKVLGAQLMCARATDMIGELGLAIGKGMTARDLAEVMMPHPTFCEGIGEAAATL